MSCVQLQLPGSKSYSNRALLLAACCNGASTLRHFLDADDTNAGLQLLTALGIVWHRQGNALTVWGQQGGWCSNRPLHCGAAGTLARFVPGLVAALATGNVCIDAHPQLRRRPMQPYWHALQMLGADIDHSNWPLVVRGGSLQGGCTQISGTVSSQFVSGLLMAAPLALKACTVKVEGVVVQPAYVAMTIASMRAFGVVMDQQADPLGWCYRVQPQAYRPQNIDIEADVSSAGPFLAWAMLHGQTIFLRNWPQATLQPDASLLELLQAWGARYTWHRQGLLFSGPAAGICYPGGCIDLQAQSDQLANLAILAPFAQGTVRFTHVGHVRHHECDRIAAMVTNLRRLGVRAVEHVDGLQVWPQSRLEAAALESFADHRIAMACSVIATKQPGCQVNDSVCVNKTNPYFFTMLAQCTLV